VAQPNIKHQITSTKNRLQGALLTVRAEQEKGGAPDPDVIARALAVVDHANVLAPQIQDPKVRNTVEVPMRRVISVLGQLGVDVTKYTKKRRGRIISSRRPGSTRAGGKKPEGVKIAGRLTSGRAAGKHVTAPKGQTGTLLKQLEGITRQMESRGMSPTILMRWTPLYAAYASMVKQGIIAGKHSSLFTSVIMRAKKRGAPTPPIRSERPPVREAGVRRAAPRPPASRAPARAAPRPPASRAPAVAPAEDDSGPDATPPPDAPINGDASFTEKLTDFWEETLWPPDKPVYARPAFWGGLLLGGGLIWGATRKGD